MVPVVLAGLGLLSLGVYAKKKGVFKFGDEFGAEHDVVYQHAVNNVRDSHELQALGHAFLAAGDTARGNVLLKKSQLSSLPKEVKAKRRAVLRQALKCQDPQKLELFAGVCEQEGCTGSATTLRQIASALRSLPSLTTK